MPDTKPATDKLVREVRMNTTWACRTVGAWRLPLLARLELLEEVRYAAFNLAESFYADGIDARPYIEAVKEKLVAYNEGIRNNTPGAPDAGAVHQKEQIHGDHK